MVDLEADDALASAAQVAAADDRVEQVIICTPDKDLGQCVGGKVVQLDRRREILLDADGVREKFGVPPESIPDWLALVGDTADGFPGLPGLGAKTAAAVLRPRTSTSRRSPTTPRRGTSRACAASIGSRRRSRQGASVADLFKVLATLRTDADVGTVDDWEWRGPTRRRSKHGANASARRASPTRAAKRSRRQRGAES